MKRLSQFSPCASRDQACHTSGKFAVEVNDAGHPGGVLCSADLDVPNYLIGTPNLRPKAISEYPNMPVLERGISGVTYTLEDQKNQPYVSFELRHKGGAKLTDGEATLGGMRVEILRRKIKDMANKSGERIWWGGGGLWENLSAGGVLGNRKCSLTNAAQP